MAPLGLRDIRKVLEPLHRRVRLMLGRAVLSAITESSKMRVVQLQGYADEVIDDAEHFEPFGFTARPLEGAEAILASLGGDRSLPVVLVVSDRRYRPLDLEPGEFALFSSDGQWVRLNKADGVLHLGAASAADFVALAQLVLERLTAIVDAFNSHTHPTGTGPSGPPAQPMATPASVAATKVKAT